MQKKIIALAIAAAISAPAFADVSVYGTVDAVVANVSGDKMTNDTQLLSGGLSPSLAGVKASEDLDGGMKASIVLEYGLNTATNQGTTVSTGGTGTTTATNIVARQQVLALSGGFGTVAAGYLQTTGFDFGMKFDVVADSVISPLQNLTSGNANFLIGTAATATRAQRAVAYISPSFGGLTIAVNQATALVGTGDLGQPTTSDATNTATLASVSYDNGPLSAEVVYAQASSAAAAPAQINGTEYAGGVSYDLGVAKLKGTYQSNTPRYMAAGVAANNSTNSVYSLGATIPVTTSGTVALSYAAATIGSNATNGGAVTTGNGSGYTVGYLQAMSKTVTAYAAYSAMSQDINGTFGVANSAFKGATGTGASTSLLAFGLNKKF